MKKLLTKNKNGYISKLGECFMENELNKWLKYLETIEPPANSEIELTEWQKEDIKFTKNMIAKLEREIYEKNKRRENHNG